MLRLPITVYDKYKYKGYEFLEQVVLMVICTLGVLCLGGFVVQDQQKD